MRWLSVALVSFALALPAHAGLEESIVGLYVRASQADLGTGFFTSDSGQIVTAYHVIRGAQGIKAVDAKGTVYNDPIVAFIAPDRDLAILQLADRPRPRTTPLRLSATIPSPSEDLTIIGYPRGLPSQFVPARTTSSAFLNSLTLQDRRGRRLFQQEMDLVMLSGPVAYSGLSGAPVISHAGVIGVFSGSYDESGGIFWAIPNKYMKDATKVGKRPAEITNWPSTMMAVGFRSLTHHFKVNPQGERLFDAYLEALTQYSRRSEALGVAAQRVAPQCVIWRPVLQAVVSDPSLTKDAAKNMLEPFMQQFLPALDSYGKAHTAFGEAGQLVVVRLQDLSTWAHREANLTVPDMRALDARISMVIKGAPSTFYYETLGDDRQQLQKAFAEMAKAFSVITEQSRPSDFARAMLRVIDTFEPHSLRHASARAVVERARWLSAFRQVGSAFEPIVYQ